MYKNNKKFKSRMQIINQIGHIQHWGLSPAVNLLSTYPSQGVQLQRPVRILLSGCSDIRHIMKTLCDISASNRRFKQIQFYFHQTKIQLLCRMLLLIHILHQTHLNYDQRTELFLDLFGNAMIKQRNARYLHHLRGDILDFIHSEDKVFTPIKYIINLKHLKFQQRDQMSEFIQSWSLKVDFDMQKMRDQKLRYLFKERYDYRNNLIDWDYNANLIGVAPIVHFYHYREWRLSGLAYEQRFSTYTQPNRTLASYAQGRRRDTRTSCLVRGYWGDIVMSPYISIGVRCDYPQKQLLFKKANYKFIGHSVQLSIYNMMYWLYRLQEDKEYVRMFKDYYRADQKTQKQLQKKDEKKKKQKNKNKNNNNNNKLQLNEIKQHQENQQEDMKRKKEEGVKQNQVQKKQQEQKKQRNNQQEQELDSDQQRQKQQVEKKNSRQIQVHHQASLPILPGFQKYNTQIYPLAMSPQTLLKKTNKFIQFFDVICLGFIHSAYLKKQRNIPNLLKKGGQILIQRATFLIPKKKEQRIELDKRLEELVREYDGLEKVNQTEENFVFRKKM